MRIAYRTEELLGKAHSDSRIDIEKFNEIMEACLTSYEYFTLKEDVQDSPLKLLGQIFTGKSILFVGAVVYSDQDHFPERNFFFPKQIAFYDVYPKEPGEGEVYSIVQIGNQLEVRHSVKGTFAIDDPAAHEPLTKRMLFTKLSFSFEALHKLVLKQAEERKTELETKTNKIKSLIDIKTPVQLFEALGYIDSGKVDTKILIEEIIQEDLIWEEDIEGVAGKNVNTIVYEFISNRREYSDRCVWCDHEFLDPSEEYIVFMQRLGKLTKDELRFSEISLSIDDDGYEMIRFTVNGIQKHWRLEKPGYIDSEYFSKFVELTIEFKTQGRYTIYGEGQGFVVDYATDEEQDAFFRNTQINRKWMN